MPLSAEHQPPPREPSECKQNNFRFLTFRQTKMTTIKIDNVDYDTDKLSGEAKAQLASIQFCDQELARLQAQSAALQTARMAYAKALQSALPAVPASDTLKFN
jgi:hypothetical protein